MKFKLKFVHYLFLMFKMGKTVFDVHKGKIPFLVQFLLLNKLKKKRLF